jgi:PEP-CTERM motif
MNRHLLALCAALFCVSLPAQSAVKVIDGFGEGLTNVAETVNGFGSTTDASINAALGTGDPTRYFSFATTPGQAVSLNNQATPGILQLSHAGGNAYSYVNLSYLFTSPTDFSGFSQLNVLGQGSGSGLIILALTDSDGDVLTSSFSMSGGSFGNLGIPLSSMTCLNFGGGSCQLSNVSMLEFYAGGFDGRAYRHGIDEINVASSAITSPIPEPSTYALMLAGLGLIGAAVRRRCMEA